MYNSHAQPDDLSISIGYVLLNLDREKGVASTQIGPSLGMESRSLTRLLKSMEEKGLIFRQADEHDGRQVNIFLTELGAEKKEEAKVTVKTFNKLIEEHVSKKDIATFIHVLSKINEVSEENFLKIV